MELEEDGFGAICTCTRWVRREGAFTPNAAHEHMEPARLESFRFSASYFPCWAIYSHKGVLRPCAVLGRQLQPLAGRLARPLRTRPSPGCPPTGVPHVSGFRLLSPLYSSFIGTCCCWIIDGILMDSVSWWPPAAPSACQSSAAPLHLQEEMETDPLVRHQDSAALLGVTWLGSALSTFGPCTLGTATWSHVGAVDRCCYVIPPSPSQSQGNIHQSPSLGGLILPDLSPSHLGPPCDNDS